MIIYRKATNLFFYVDFVSATLLKVFIQSFTIPFCVGSYLLQIRTLTSSSSICILFIYFSSLIALAKTLRLLCSLFETGSYVTLADLELTV